MTSISEQLEMGWHFNPAEPRDAQGQWVKVTNAVALHGGHIIAGSDPEGGQAVMVFGDPATAQHVLTYVPGVGDVMGMPGEVERAAKMKARMDAEGKGTTAVVFWRGYTPPRNPEHALSKYDAMKAAGKLARFQTTLEKMNPSAHHTVLGHSYGSLVAGEASRVAGMKPEDLVFIGSPGTGAHSGTEMSVDPSHLWAGANTQDPVARASGMLSRDFKGNPVRPGWGAQIFAADDPGVVFPGRFHVAAHSAYWDQGSQSLDNISRIATSQYDEVSLRGTMATAQFAQPTELGWRFDPSEARDAHGRWTTGGSGYVVPDTNRLSIRRPAHPTKPYYGHPRDHPFFAAHPVSAKNIVDAYDQASPEEKAQGMRWYADAHVLAKAIGQGDVTKGAGLLASYSPQSAWPVNMLNAARAMELGRAIGPGEGMITGSMQHHAESAMSGASTDENFGRGAPKIHAFANLIEHGGDAPDDQLGQVVLDRHAMSVAMGVRLPKIESDKAPIDKERYYQHVADQYRKAALAITARGTPVSPHQVQAITWLRQQRANAAEDIAQVGKTIHGRAGAGRGRQAMIGNAWDRWRKLEQAEHYPVVYGTTEMAGTISSQLDLAAWEHELRGYHGRWARTGGAAKAASGAHHYGTTSFEPHMYFADVPARIKARAEIQKDMDIQGNVIPGIAEHQQVTFVSRVPDDNEEGGAMGETMPDGTIFMRPETTAALGGGLAAAKALEKDQADRGFWTPIDKKYTAADHVVSHEVGHVVGLHLGQEVMHDPEYWGPIAKAIGILPPRTYRRPGSGKDRIRLEDLADWADRNSYALEKGTSIYGASSPFEMQADLWAEFTMSSHPRPAAMAFGKYALAHLPAADLPAKAAAS